MKKEFSAILIMFSPSMALASGGEVLSLFWVEVGGFFAVMISLYLATIRIKEKLIVFGVYFLTTVLVLLSTSGMPYLDNMYLINSVNGAVPLLAWLAVFIYFVKNHNKSLKDRDALKRAP